VNTQTDNIQKKPWNTKRSYSRDDSSKRYSNQDPEKFMISNSGVKQSDGSWIIKRNLILLRKSPIVKNGRFIVKIKRVEGNFNCSGQGLKTLEGGPEYVGGSFWCGSNPSLRSLKHGPKYVGRIYECSYNGLTSLKHLPEELNGDFEAAGNKFTTMKGFPSYIKGEFDMTGNKLESLEHMPQTDGEACFLDNPLKSLYGFKIPTKSGIVRFSDELNTLTGSEIGFTLHMQYDLEKTYKNYHDQLFKYIIKKWNKESLNDIEQIIWPEGFLNEKRRNVIESKKGLQKFNI